MGNSNSAVAKRVERAGSSKMLSLEGCGMSGSDVDKVLKKVAAVDLRMLDLSGNKVKRETPSSVAAFAATLKKLRLDGNKLEGVGCVGRLASLEELSLAANCLSAVSAEDLAGMVRLKSLNLSQNALTCVAVPPALVCLTSLDLSRNRLTEVPAAVLDLPKLASLDVSHNRLVALQLSSDQPPAQLQSLDVSHNGITALPVELFASTKLITFAMDGNPVTRADLEQLLGKEPYEAFMARQKKTVDKQIAGGLTAQMISEGKSSA